MRLTPTKIVTTFLSVITFLIFWYLLDDDETKIKNVKICHQSDGFLRQLHDLTDRVHHILSTLGVTHWLCYGSLWGQIRIGRSLSWDTSAQMCARNEELSPVDELYLQRAFIKHGLSITYSNSDGAYEVRVNQNDKTGIDPNAAFLELILFELDDRNGFLRRVGWKRRLLPPDCEMKSLECFPPRLVLPPLPLKEFGGYVMPVPKEGIEIQKYHYQENWWKEIKPINC